jgi:hypothetical protein
LVSFTFGLAGADWDVWQFYNEEKDDDKTFRKGIDDLPTVPIILSEWTNLNPITSTGCCIMPMIGQLLKKCNTVLCRSH